MKLKNKLLPMTILAASTAAILPISSLTSCASGANEIKGLQKPTFDKYETKSSSIDPDQATKVYAKFADEQPQNFKEDFTWGVFQNWMSFFDDSNFSYYDDPTTPSSMMARSAKTNSIMFSMTNPTFSSCKVAGAGSGKVRTFPTISFKMSVAIDVDLDVWYGDVTEVGEYASHKTSHKIKFQVDAEYKDMIFFAYVAQRQDKKLYTKESDIPTESDPSWWITFATESSQQLVYWNAYNVDWSIKAKGSFSDVITNEENGVVTDSYQTSLNLNTTINDVSTFERFVQYKDYDNSEYLKLSNKKISGALPPVFMAESNWDNWFNPNPENYTNLLLANAVLLDNSSYYFSDLVPPPSFEAEDILTGTFAYEESQPEEDKAVKNDSSNVGKAKGKFNLGGWKYQPTKGETFDASKTIYWAIFENNEKVLDNIFLEPTDNSSAYQIYKNGSWVEPAENEKLKLTFNSDSDSNYIISPIVKTGKSDLLLHSYLSINQSASVPTFVNDDEKATPKDGDYMIGTNGSYDANGELEFMLPKKYIYKFRVDNNEWFEFDPKENGYIIKISNPITE